MILKMFKNNKGQAMVEFALVIPIFLLMIFGMVEFGRIYSYKLATANMARQVARQAAVVGLDNTKIRDAAIASGTIFGLSSSNINAPTGSSTTAYSYTTNTTSIPLTFSVSVISSAGNATVNVTYQVKIYTPIISNIIGTPKTVSSNAVMRLE